MSYRKKHHPAKPERETRPLFDVEYSNPGVDRTLPTSRLNLRPALSAARG